MVEQQYIAPGLPQPAGLSGAPTLHDSIPTTTASAYHELASYSSIPSSFNGIQCDPNLLTPVSVVDSPPLHGVSKIGSRYPPPPSTPNQQPSPPGSSDMYHQQWAGHFDVNGQSPAASSPMTSQAPGGGEFLHASYVHDGRRTPGPPEPYMGAFGVSNGPEPQTMEHPYYVNMGPPVDHQVQMGIHHREMPTTPLLSESQPIQYRRRHSPEDSSLHNQSAGVPRSLTASPRRRPAFQASGRVKKRHSKRPGASRTATQEDPVNEHKNCFGQEVPPTLKSTCPDEERCIFESRWKHRHQKGQDMWESIQSDFHERFQKRPGKEMLQMKFKRGRAKYFEWIPKDEDLLREAWLRNEKNRYQQVLEIFYEMGGSRNMRLNASDIEIKVVNDLKLEEGLYMESYGSNNIRRRRKPDSVRKRAGHGVDNDMSVNDEMMSIGSHTTHEDEVINQVHGLPNIKMEEQGPGDHPNIMDTQMWDQQMKMEPGAMPQRNDRMQHLMRLSPISQPMYGGRREA
ncbi:hypothetical protein FLAG1_02699 [Fusarium langsethiae]|uniref:Uncharacterized protein n=1 Tax=Fusarium langsethiae TaxID=179993 RepID=A0A0N0DGQ8_FUSLA|nr:hypothetical protein FLAG1_02699 [Fusarium langsethiae]GKU00534.1 unnamed protein product [Fusarium langsethiae]GKU17185.1 unnamed protein product [Fusarium langsethiae]